MKRIAIYYPWIYLTSGIERTILEFVKRSQHDCTVFTNHFDKNQTYPEFQKVKLIELDPISVSRNILSVWKAAATISCQKIDLQPFDMLMVHSDGLGDLIQMRNHSLPTICVCHTPLRVAFDSLYRQSVFNNLNPSQKIIHKFLNQSFIHIDRKLWRHYRHIIFNSNESHKRALNGRLVSPNQRNLSIIHPGVEWRDNQPSTVFEPYFLLPGRIMWTKNIELGINAFIEAKIKGLIPNKFKLVIAGRVDKKSQPYLRTLQRIAAGRKDVEFIKNPTDSNLKELYSKCWTSLQCAFNEDWGLTILEAYAHGKPVIAINQGGPKESVTPKQTGLLIENNLNDYSKALGAMANNVLLVKSMGDNAYKFAKQYDWNKYVTKLDQLVSDLEK